MQLAATLYQGEDGVQGESFNFGPSTPIDYPVIDLIRELQKDWPGAEYRLTSDAKAGKEASLLKLACEKAQARLGWRAVLDFAQTASYTAFWYRTYYTNPASVQDLSLEQIAAYERAAASQGMRWATATTRPVLLNQKASA